MQNRRLYRDDDRGLAVPLNEVDSQGKPLVVSATYYL